MKVSEVSYQTSTDYKQLEELLVAGKKIVIFMVIEINGELYPDDFIVRISFYADEVFYLGGNLLFVSDILDGHITFEEFCNHYRVKFIPPNI